MGTEVNTEGDHHQEQSAHVKIKYTRPAIDASMNYELPCQPQSAPKREKPPPASACSKTARALQTLWSIFFAIGLSTETLGFTSWISGEFLPILIEYSMCNCC